MDVLTYREINQYHDKIKNIIKHMKFKNHKLMIQGSASLSAQRYFGDYDFFCDLKRSSYKPEKVFAEFRRILKFILDNPDHYFIEMKMQDVYGDKERLYKDQKFDGVKFYQEYEDLDYVKIDTVVRIDNIFTEVSVIYSFNPDEPTEKEINKSLKDDIKEFYSEGQYFKCLKRLFSIFREKEQKKDLLRLTKFFNSEVGRDYQKLSNLKAIKKVLEYYKDPVTKRKVIINLKDIREKDSIAGIDAAIERIGKLVNGEAKEILDEY